MIYLKVRDSCYLSTDPNACSSSYTKAHNGDAVLVCGSPGEIANDPLSRGFGTLGNSYFVVYSFFKIRASFLVLLIAILSDNFFVSQATSAQKQQIRRGMHGL